MLEEQFLNFFPYRKSFLCYWLLPFVGFTFFVGKETHKNIEPPTRIFAVSPQAIEKNKNVNYGIEKQNEQVSYIYLSIPKNNSIDFATSKNSEQSKKSLDYLTSNRNSVWPFTSTEPMFDKFYKNAAESIIQDNCIVYLQSLENYIMSAKKESNIKEKSKGKLKSFWEPTSLSFFENVNHQRQWLFIERPSLYYQQRLQNDFAKSKFWPLLDKTLQIENKDIKRLVFDKEKFTKFKAMFLPSLTFSVCLEEKQTENLNYFNLLKRNTLLLNNIDLSTTLPKSISNITQKLLSSPCFFDKVRQQSHSLVDKKYSLYDKQMFKNQSNCRENPVSTLIKAYFLYDNFTKKELLDINTRELSAINLLNPKLSLKNSFNKNHFILLNLKKNNSSTIPNSISKAWNLSVFSKFESVLDLQSLLININKHESNTLMTNKKSQYKPLMKLSKERLYKLLINSLNKTFLNLDLYNPPEKISKEERPQNIKMSYPVLLVSHLNSKLHKSNKKISSLTNTNSSSIPQQIYPESPTSVFEKGKQLLSFGLSEKQIPVYTNSKSDSFEKMQENSNEYTKYKPLLSSKTAFFNYTASFLDSLQKVKPSNMKKFDLNKSQPNITYDLNSFATFLKKYNFKIKNLLLANKLKESQLRDLDIFTSTIEASLPKTKKKSNQGLPYARPSLPCLPSSPSSPSSPKGRAGKGREAGIKRKVKKMEKLLRAYFSLKTKYVKPTKNQYIKNIYETWLSPNEKKEFKVVGSLRKFKKDQRKLNFYKRASINSPFLGYLIGNTSITNFSDLGFLESQYHISKSVNFEGATKIRQFYKSRRFLKREIAESRLKKTKYTPRLLIKNRCFILQSDYKNKSYLSSQNDLPFCLIKPKVLSSSKLESFKDLKQRHYCFKFDKTLGFSQSPLATRSASESKLVENMKDVLNLEKETNIEKDRKLIQKKRRKKKLIKETRRRKKRRRFYPRPTWLRFRFYLKFIKKRDFYITQNFNNRNVSLPQKQCTSFGLLNYSVKNKAINNQSFLGSTPNSFFTISRPVLGNLKRLLWKSYWLRSNLNPYLKRVKAYLRNMKECTQKSELLINLTTFFKNLDGRFNSYHQTWDMGNEFIGGKWENSLYFAEYNRITYLRIQELISQIRENVGQVWDQKAEEVNSIYGETENEDQQANFYNIKNKGTLINVRMSHLTHSKIQDNKRQDVFGKRKITDFWVKLGKAIMSENESGLKTSVLKKNKEWWLFASKDYMNEPTISQLRMFWALSKTAPSLNLETSSADSLIGKDFNNKLNNQLNSFLYKRKQIWVETGKMREQIKNNKTKKMYRNITRKCQTLLNEQFEILKQETPNIKKTIHNLLKQRLFKLQITDRFEGSKKTPETSNLPSDRFNLIPTTHGLPSGPARREGRAGRYLPFFKSVFYKTRQKNEKLQFLNQRKRSMSFKMKKPIFSSWNNKFLKQEQFLGKRYTLSDNQRENSNHFNLMYKKLIQSKPKNYAFQEPWLNTLTNKSSYWWASITGSDSLGFPQDFVWLPIYRNLFPSLFPSIEDSQLQYINKSYFSNFSLFLSNNNDQKKENNQIFWFSALLFHFCSILSIISISQIRSVLKFNLLIISKAYKAFLTILTYSYTLFLRLKFWDRKDSRTAFQPIEVNNPIVMNRNSSNLNFVNPLINKTKAFPVLLNNPGNRQSARLKVQNFKSQNLKLPSSLPSLPPFQLEGKGWEGKGGKGEITKGYFNKTTFSTKGSNDLNMNNKRRLLALQLSFVTNGLLRLRPNLLNTQGTKKELDEVAGSQKYLQLSKSFPKILLVKMLRLFITKTIFLFKSIGSNKLRKPKVFSTKDHILISKLLTGFPSQPFQPEGKGWKGGHDGKNLVRIKTTFLLYSFLWTNFVLSNFYNLYSNTFVVFIQTFNTIRFGPKSLFKFLEKPGELILDWIAYLFLLEWASDITNTIPEDVDIYLGNSFYKITRLIYGIGLANIVDLRSFNLYVYLQSSMFNISKENIIPNRLYENITLFNLGTPFIQHRIFHLYEILLYQFYQPDTDLIIRKKKGVIFWDIWGDFLMQEATNSKMSLSDLESDKDEQSKLFDIALENYDTSFKKPVENDIFNLPLAFGLKHPYFKIEITKDFFNIKPKVLSSKSQREQSEPFTILTKDIQNLNKFPSRLKNFTNSSFGLQAKALKQSNKNLKVKGPLGYAQQQQFLTYQGKDTELFIDLHPPKSFSMINLLKQNEPVQTSIGPLVCQIFAGMIAKQVSKNVLIIGPSLQQTSASTNVINSRGNLLSTDGEISNSFLMKQAKKSAYSFLLSSNENTSSGSSINGKLEEKTLLIQAIAGETELKIITDNAHRYAIVDRGLAVGIKWLREVFDSIALHTPCLFLIEDIHAIGEKRPLLISDDEKEGPASDTGKKIFSVELAETHEKYKVSFELSKHIITHYKKPYRGDFSMLIPTNRYSFNLFRNHTNILGSNKLNPYSLSLGAPKISIESNDSPSSDYSQKGKNPSQNTKSFTLPTVFSNFASLSNINLNSSINLTQKFNYSSRLQVKSLEYFSPPATSPFSILTLKEEKKLKPYKIVSEVPWGISDEELAHVSKFSYSIRVKVAILAHMAFSALGDKMDIITDLLVIMDSVRSNRGFVVFATTNIPYVLDPALRRPGRLDETIAFGVFPNLLLRWEILKSSFGLFTAGKQQTGFQKGISFDLTYSINAPFFKILNKQALSLKSSLEKNFYNQLVSSLKFESFKTFKQSPGFSKLKEQKPKAKGTSAITSRSKSKKYLHKILSQTYFISSNMLYEANFNNIKTNYSHRVNFFDYLQPLNMETSSLYISLYAPSSLFKNQIVKLMSGKLGELLFFSNSLSNLDLQQSIGLPFLKNTSNAFTPFPPFPSDRDPSPKGREGREQVFANPLDESQIPAYANFSNTWKALSALIISFVQKRFLLISRSSINSKKLQNQKHMITNPSLYQTQYPLANTLISDNLIIPQLLLFNNKNTLNEPPSPSTTHILLPARRYEIYKRSFAFFSDKKTTIGINETIRNHQQQRLVKKLYGFPAFNSNISRKNSTFSKETFGSLVNIKSSPFNQQTGVNNNKNFSNFSNATLTIDSFSSILQKPSHSNWFVKKRILMRHKNYLTNQWWNGQLPEHNAETTFLSDIEWRYYFLESTGDLLLDFPDAEQHYNPKNRRWFLTKGDYHNWFDFEKTLYSEIYTHFVFDSFVKAYHIYEKNRETLDFYSFYVLRKGLYNSLNEFETAKLYTRFLCK